MGNDAITARYGQDAAMVLLPRPNGPTTCDSRSRQATENGPPFIFSCLVTQWVARQEKIRMVKTPPLRGLTAPATHSRGPSGLQSILRHHDVITLLVPAVASSPCALLSSDFAFRP